MILKKQYEGKLINSLS